MSEPVKRRTQAGCVVASSRTSAFRHSPIAKALSLCGVLSMLMLASTPLHAASEEGNNFSVMSAKAQHSLLLDVASVGKRLVTVGDRGHILTSDDNGASWMQAKVPTKQMLTAVFFVDDSHGWAVGHDAQILASTDGGATWTQQYQDLKREAPLLDVWFNDANHGLAVGAYGALIETTDGGKTWNDVSERLDNEDQYHLNAIAEVKEAGLFIVGEQGSMFRSADGGQTWERLEGPYEGSLFGVIGTGQPATLLVYGLRGNLYRSTDFGSTWQQVQLLSETGSLEFGLAGGSLLKNGDVVIVGHGGSVLTSKDSGRTFTVINRADRASLASAVADAAGNLVLVGQGGVQIATPTGAEPGQKQ